MTVFQNYRAKLEKILPLNDEEFSKIIMHISVKKIKKNEYFLHEGEVCNYVPYLNSGLTKTCFRIHDIDYILEFNLDGDWITAYNSFLTKTPATFSVQALEDTEFFLHNYQSLQVFYATGAKYERFGRIQAQMRTKYHRNAKFFLLSTPEERYRQIMEERPELFDIVPLKEIAYYIGVTPESLSRIRKRISKIL